MGCWYSGEGCGVLRDVPGARKILNEFEEEYSLENSDPIDITPGEVAGTICVEIRWHGHTSGSHVTALDNKLAELIPYIVGEEAIVFDYTHENDSDKMYIGTDAQRETARSRVALTAIQAVGEFLEPAELTQAIDLLTTIREGYGKEGSKEDSTQSDSTDRVHEQPDDDGG